MCLSTCIHCIEINLDLKVALCHRYCSSNICTLVHHFLATSYGIRKVRVLSLPEMVKEKSTFRVKALRRKFVVSY